MSKGQFQGKVIEISFLTKRSRNVCNTSCYGILTDKFNYSINLVMSISIQGHQKSEIKITILKNINSKSVVRLFNVILMSNLFLLLF